MFQQQQTSKAKAFCIGIFSSWNLRPGSRLPAMTSCRSSLPNDTNLIGLEHFEFLSLAHFTGSCEHYRSSVHHKLLSLLHRGPKHDRCSVYHIRTKCQRIVAYSMLLGGWVSAFTIKGSYDFIVVAVRTVSSVQRVFYIMSIDRWLYSRWSERVFRSMWQVYCVWSVTWWVGWDLVLQWSFRL